MARDDKLREEIGIYENLMEDFSDLADIFIGNYTMDDLKEDGEYEPLLKLISEFHFSPENERLRDEIMRRLKLIEKKVLKLRTQVDANFKKGKFLYRNR